MPAARQVPPGDFGQEFAKALSLYRKYTQTLTFRNSCQVHNSRGTGKAVLSLFVSNSTTVSQSMQLSRPDAYTLTVRILSGLGRACNKKKKHTHIYAQLNTLILDDCVYPHSSRPPPHASTLTYTIGDDTQPALCHESVHIKAVEQEIREQVSNVYISDSVHI